MVLPSPKKSLGKIAALLNIRPGDGLVLGILLAHSFLKGMSRVFFEVPVNSLFLSRFSTALLPLVYVGTAIVTTLLGLAYAKLEEKSTPAALLTRTLAFLSAVAGVLYLALLLTHNPVLIVGAMIWKDVNWMLTSVSFWALAGMLLDVRQGKRLFGLITAGEITAGILSGFSVPFVVKLSGTLSLLLISCAVLAGNVVLLWYTFRLFRGHGGEEKDAGSEAETQPKPQPLAAMFRERYLGMIFVISVLSIMGFYFIEYTFYGQAEAAFPDEAKMASFLGLFYGVTGAVQLVASASAGAALTRYGMGLGLMMLPVTDFLTSGTAMASGGIGALAAMLFGAVLAAKLCDDVLRNTVERSVFTLLYQPLARHRRLRAQAVRESIVEPVAMGLCGALLYAFRNVLHLGPSVVVAVIVGISAMWVVLAFLLQREYKVQVTSVLTAGRLGGAELSFEDPLVMEALRKGLSSRRGGEVIYSLTMLEQAGEPVTTGELTALLEHEEKEVRRFVLQQLVERGQGEVLGAVRARLGTETDAGLRGEILCAMCALGDAGIADEVIPWLDDDAPEVREGALTGLLRFCGLEGALSGGGRLNAMLRSSDAKERALAARILGDIGIAGYYRPLLPLLADSDHGVCRAAMDAVQRLGCQQALPSLVTAAATPALRPGAFEALVSFGDAVLPFVEDALRATETAAEMRIFMARVAGKVDTAAGVEMLLRHVDAVDGEVRAQIFAGLAAHAAVRRPLDAGDVRRLAERELGEAVWLLAMRMDVVAAAPAVLHSALRHEFDERIRRVFLLLATVHPARVMKRALRDVRSDDNTRRAQAIEAIDNVVERDVKAMLLPLVDELSDEARLERMNSRFPQERRTAEARLFEAASQPAGRLTGWTRSCAIYTAGAELSDDWRGVLERAASDPEPVVRETALRALAREVSTTCS